MDVRRGEDDFEVICSDDSKDLSFTSVLKTQCLALWTWTTIG